jgi:polysaccharide pyruvyl transferase CsaB
MRKICAHLKKTRLFVLCGGTLIQNSTSNRSLAYYHTLCELAKKYGARVMIWGGGVGPLFGDDAADLAADIIENCDAAGIRDERSVRSIKALGVEVKDLYVSADAALLTPPLPFSADGAVRSGHCFAVCPRSVAGLRREGTVLSEKEMQALLVNAVRRIADKYKIMPLWIPLSEEDEALCQKLCRKCGRGRVMSRLQAGEIVSLLSLCLFSVCVRLHGAVFSSCAGIPAICLPYDPKVESFAECADHHVVDMGARDLSPLSVIKIADHILSYRDRLCANVEARAAELRCACSADAEAARRLWNR